MRKLDAILKRENPLQKKLVRWSEASDHENFVLEIKEGIDSGRTSGLTHIYNKQRVPHII